jgi:hypothetical protein
MQRSTRTPFSRHHHRERPGSGGVRGELSRKSTVIKVQKVQTPTLDSKTMET